MVTSAYVRAEGTLEESLETDLMKIENECNEILICAKSELFHGPAVSPEKLGFHAGLLYARATNAVAILRGCSRKSRKALDRLRRTKSFWKTCG